MAVLYGKNYGKPTLDLNFAGNKSLIDTTTEKNYVTFSRAQSGNESTYIGSDGLIKYAAADEPRFDHDPVTGESLGLLIEEERTNIVLNSVSGEIQNKTNMTVPTSVYGPGGTDTAFQYLSVGGTVASRITFKSVGVANATQYTATVYVKGVNYNTVTFGFGNNGFSIGGSRRTFYLDTLTTQGSGGSAAAVSIEDAGNGWRRLRITTTATTSATGIIAYLDLGNTSSGAHTTDQGFQIYGFQIEAGTFPTSYIPTSGSTVTRAPDIASIEGTNFSSWYNQSEGSFFIDFNGLQTVAYSRIIGTNGVPTPIYWANTHIRSYGLNAGPIITADDSIPNKAALSYSTTIPEDTLCVNGTSDSTTTGFNTASNITAINLFATNTAPNTVGHISRLTYYPKRLPDIELQQLTK